VLVAGVETDLLPEKAGADTDQNLVVWHSNLSKTVSEIFS
jgi:hypothetical protein